MSLGGPIGRLVTPVSLGVLALGGVGLVGASPFLSVGVSEPPGVTGRGSPVGFCAPEGFCACAIATVALAANSAAAAAVFNILLIESSFFDRSADEHDSSVNARNSCPFLCANVFRVALAPAQMMTASCYSAEMFAVAKCALQSRPRV